MKILLLLFWGMLVFACKTTRAVQIGDSSLSSVRINPPPVSYKFISVTFHDLASKKDIIKLDKIDASPVAVPYGDYQINVKLSSDSGAVLYQNCNVEEVFKINQPLFTPKIKLCDPINNTVLPSTGTSDESQVVIDFEVDQSRIVKLGTLGLGADSPCVKAGPVVVETPESISLRFKQPIRDVLVEGGNWNFCDVIISTNIPSGQVLVPDPITFDIDAVSGQTLSLRLETFLRGLSNTRSAFKFFGGTYQGKAVPMERDALNIQFTNAKKMCENAATQILFRISVSNDYTKVDDKIVPLKMTSFALPSITIPRPKSVACSNELFKPLYQEFCKFFDYKPEQSKACLECVEKYDYLSNDIALCPALVR